VANHLHAALRRPDRRAELPPILLSRGIGDWA